LSHNIRVEFSGKVIKSASFEEWARTTGKEIVKRAAQERTISFFGKHRAARNDLWKDLELITKQPALHAALSKLAADYSTTLGNVSEAFELRCSPADFSTGSDRAWRF
jgi:hypothetical protein